MYSDYLKGRAHRKVAEIYQNHVVHSILYDPLLSLAKVLDGTRLTLILAEKKNQFSLCLERK
jgi:hypothetical protein